MAWLTKSRFMAGLQCPKRLWMEIHEPLEEDLPDSMVFVNGRAVDRLVQTLEPGPVISRQRGMPAAIAETSRAMDAGVLPVIYQPAFRAGDLAVIADVLRHWKGGRTLIEVKSATSVKPEYIPDVAFQALVMRRVKLPADRVVIAYVNNQFVLSRAGEYEGLINEQDVTGEVEAVLPEVSDSAAEHLSVMASRERPRIVMGQQCEKPYACPFIDRCAKERGPTPQYPVSLLPRGTKVVERLIAEGYEDLEAVPARRLTSPLHQRVHQATVTGVPFFDPVPTEFLRELAYPMAHLDFETLGFAVPEVLGTRPYEQLPFQFSVHVEESAKVVRHDEYLAADEFGDLEALARALLAALPESGAVFAYNAPFERGVLEGLADRVPASANALREVTDRLVDLLPVTRAAYYHRDMLGSWSIKAVLPTIAPELDYANLDGVSEGEGAQLAYLKLREPGLAAKERERLIAALLRYCERDTWGMVVLRRFLCGQNMPDMRSGSVTVAPQDRHG